MAIESRNPATGELLERFDEPSAGQIEGALQGARAAFLDWKDRPFRERAEPLRRAAEILRDRSIREFVNVKTVWMK